MSVPFEQSPALAALPRIRHGFFGRQGGVSSGVFAALNVSEATADEPGRIAENRARIAETMGFPPSQLASVKQVHSNRVLTLEAPPTPGARPEADALVTRQHGLLLGILTADCTPILFAEPETGIIGAAHAGWRGAATGIIAQTIEAMVALGARREAIIAAIGPMISGANYEVGPEFEAEFLALEPKGAAHFSPGPKGRAHFDLGGFVAGQLHGSDIAAIEVVGGCTYAHPERYFSHRHATHAGTTTGRQMAAIGLA